jgi:hypothetical protein
MKKYIILAATSVVSAAAGAVGGYLLAKRRLDAQYNERLEVEIEATKRFYSLMHKKDLKTPEAAVAALIPPAAREITETSTEDLKRIVEGLKYATPEPEKVAEPVNAISNIFDGTNPDEDYEAEVSKRNVNRPYIISFDVFMANEVDHKQISLTWFAGDGVLVDDGDKPIERVKETVGNNLNRFGEFSKDPRIVYVRNEKFGADFEVALHDGKYSVDVLGLDEPTRAG